MGCCKKPAKENCNTCAIGNGFMILVLYILLAIILGSVIFY